MADRTRSWTDLLAEAVDLRSQLSRLEGPLGMRSGAPRPPADPAALDATEAVLGCPLSQPYRRFLTVADGWPDFHLSVDLFGTPELLSGAHAQTIAELLLGYELDLEDNELEPGDVLPVAVASEAVGLVVVVKEGHAAAGRVFWWDGDSGEQFDDFSDMFVWVLQNQRGYRDSDGA